MIIDIHSHVCAAPQLYRFKANLLASRGQPPHGFTCDPFSGEFVRDHFDDIKALIESIDFLTAEDRHKIFEGNARRLFTRFT